jgi:hypothetical protein
LSIVITQIPKPLWIQLELCFFTVVILKRSQNKHVWSNQASNKNENMRGGPTSHIDQGRHSRFTARVLQRPGARDDWWTLDFANAFVSPGVNSRGELVPSHGASRRQLGENSRLWENCGSTVREVFGFELSVFESVNFVSVPRHA